MCACDVMVAVSFAASQAAAAGGVNAAMGDVNIVMVSLDLFTSVCASVFALRIALTPRFHKFPNAALLVVLIGAALTMWTCTLYAAVGFRHRLISSLNDAGVLQPTVFCKFQGVCTVVGPPTAAHLSVQKYTYAFRMYGRCGTAPPHRPRRRVLGHACKGPYLRAGRKACSLVCRWSHLRQQRVCSARFVPLRGLFVLLPGFMMTFLGTTFCVTLVALALTVRTVVAAQSKPYSFQSVTRVLAFAPLVCAGWAAVWYVLKSACSWCICVFGCNGEPTWWQQRRWRCALRDTLIQLPGRGSVQRVCRRRRSLGDVLPRHRSAVDRRY